ncbi:ABC transporter ATP-binding protein, partial [Xanthovirga aplysinae]|uniref:ABC transporter ATP-binding protein n=1 Tax=Xanthovirga aplysinae TaxID=2529853 RepID=UPI0012BC2A71
WLKGENGSGKTTLLKSIAGLIPFQGDIVLDQRISIRKNVMLFKQRVNYSEAEPLYPAFLTGKDLIQFYCETLNEDFEKATDLADTFVISNFLNQKIASYSSGMLKKLSLVLAFIGNPSLILLDEPLITLDNKAVVQIHRLIEQYSNQGATFLLTSHQSFDLFSSLIPTQLVLKNKAITIEK